MRGGVASSRWTSAGQRGRSDKTVRALESYGELGRQAAAHLEQRRAQHYSEYGIAGDVKRLRRFLAWCEERSLERPEEVTRPVLEQYQRWLFHQRKPDGRPLGVLTQHGLLQAVVTLFQWLSRQHLILFNPGAELVLPRLEQRLPRHVLTVLEVESVLSQPDVSEPAGVRDRAILETLYSTGMRRAELVNLGIYDLDANRQTVTIRLGKGKKDRVVPIGDRALGWINKYLVEARSLLLHKQTSDVLFVSSYGEALSTGYLTHLVREYIAAAGTGKTGSCHLLRHTCATLMLENGADIRYVQVLLGHAQLKTTEIYTHVAITKLKEVHERTHPSARLGRQAAPGAGETR